MKVELRIARKEHIIEAEACKVVGWRNGQVSHVIKGKESIVFFIGVLNFMKTIEF